MNQHTSDNIQTLTVEDSILLGGILAKIYSELDYSSPIQNWAWAIPNRQLPVGDTVYRVGPARCMLDGKETACVQLTIDGPGGSTTYQFPIHELRAVGITLRGFQVQ